MTADDCRIWRERIGALVLGQLADERAHRHRGAPRGMPGLPRRGRRSRRRWPRCSREPIPTDSPRPRPRPPRPRRPHRPADRGRARRHAARGGCGLRLRRWAPRRRPRRPRSLIAVSLTGSTPIEQPEPRDRRLQRRSRRASRRGQPRVPRLGQRRQPSTSAASGPARCARSGCGAATGPKVPAGSFRYVYDGESDEAELSSGRGSAGDVTAIGLRAGSRTFVAPLSAWRRRRPGAPARRED